MFAIISIQATRRHRDRKAKMTVFIYNHEHFFLWLTIVSIIGFIASLILIPWMITKIPSDYFSHPKRQKYLWNNRSLIVRWIFIFLKNILGVLFVIGGIAMLLLPGQGILTILTGLLIMDFPCKYKVEIWILKHPFILKSINQLRAKAKQRPLEI